MHDGRNGLLTEITNRDQALQVRNLRNGAVTFFVTARDQRAI